MVLSAIQRKIICYGVHVWYSVHEKRFIPYTNSKGPDQPSHSPAWSGFFQFVYIFYGLCKQTTEPLIRLTEIYLGHCLPFPPLHIIWAAIWENIPSDVHLTKIQVSLHILTVWSVFVVHLKKLCILVYPKCTHWRFRSDCMNAQSDLNVRWVHMLKVHYQMLWLIFLFNTIFSQSTAVYVYLFQSIFDQLEGEEMRRARTRSNPYETIRGVFFLNR